MYFPRFHTEPEDAPVMDSPQVLGEPLFVHDADPWVVDRLELRRRWIVLVAWSDVLLTREDIWFN